MFTKKKKWKTVSRWWISVSLDLWCGQLWISVKCAKQKKTLSESDDPIATITLHSDGACMRVMFKQRKRNIGLCGQIKRLLYWISHFFHAFPLLFTAFSSSCSFAVVVVDISLTVLFWVCYSCVHTESAEYWM